MSILLDSLDVTALSYERNKEDLDNEDKRDLQ